MRKLFKQYKFIWFIQFYVMSFFKCKRVIIKIISGLLWKVTQNKKKNEILGNIILELKKKILWNMKNIQNNNYYLKYSNLIQILKQNRFNEFI